MNTEFNKRKSILTILITAIVSVALTLGILAGISYLKHGKTIDLNGDTHDHGEVSQLWTCGMHPMVITKEPGLCPICNMELTPLEEDKKSSQKGEREIAFWKEPDSSTVYKTKDEYSGDQELIAVYEDQLINGVDIHIDPVIEQNMGIRTAKVEKGPLVHSIRTYGHITYDETRTVQVSLKFSGWIEKLHADFTGSHVKKGEPLFEIYSPELFAVQEEYLSAVRSLKDRKSKVLQEMRASSRQRLINFGIDSKEIERIEKSGQISKNLVIRSPYTGVVTQKNVDQGTFIKSGALVLSISDLSKVWVEAHIFEYEMSQLSTGQSAFMESPYMPGKTFEGEVAYIYPYLQKKTRDVIVRLEFDNPDLILKPDMYTNVIIQTTATKPGLFIDSEAVIRSGDSNTVFVYKGDGHFMPRKVKLGMGLDNSKVEILSGLAFDETIVVSGQFMLDSESKLKETILKMMEPEKYADKKKKEDDFFEDMETKKDSFFDDM